MILKHREKCDAYAEAFFKKRQRRGATLWDAKSLMKKPNYFGAMMVELGDADALDQRIYNKLSKYN
ncbi:MAG: phosphate acyltransferase [Ignavibacteriales bacterium]|nr:phosphate acyltransferase [Ignavibacteriales bacterium]